MGGESWYYYRTNEVVASSFVYSDMFHCCDNRFVVCCLCITSNIIAYITSLLKKKKEISRSQSIKARQESWMDNIAIKNNKINNFSIVSA